jgi:photosystem II stability/assembly factor-like uncharacterized protein
VKSFAIFAALLLIPAVLLGGANHWTSSGPGVGSVYRVYTAPQDPNEGFVLTAAGLYKTTDGGQSWRPANGGLPRSSTSNFVAATNQTLYLSIGNRIFASDDGAEHWSPRGSIGLVPITALAFDPISKMLIAGTSGVNGLYVSSDGGQTWNKSDVHAASAFVGIDFIVVSATAAYARASSSWMMLRSADAGNTWQPINVSTTMLSADSSTSWVYATTIDGKSLMVSKDEAKTWTSLPSVPASLIFKVVTIGKSVFAATTGGVLAYSDGARSWQTLSPTFVSDLAVSVSTPRHFYAAPHRGVIAFVDGDANWTTHNAGLPGAIASDVDIASSQPSTAYAVTNDGVFRTDDAGQDWTLVNATPPYAQHVVVSPATPDTAYISSSGIQRTRDRGLTWKQVTPSFASALAIAPSDPKTLYASFASGMEKSTDGGDTWTTISSGLFLGYYYYSGFSATSIAVDPSSASNVLIGNNNGISKTMTGGASWLQLSPYGASALTIDTSDHSTVFAGKNTGGVIRSNDGGATWNAAGLLNKNVPALAISATSLYAGTADGHIYRSDDGAQTWIGFDDGLNFGTVSRVVVDSSGRHLFAATNAGVYEYDILDDDFTPMRLPDDSLRTPRELDAIVSSAKANAAFVVPVAGAVRGAGGTLYTTELTLSNARQSPQVVLVTWLPRGGDGAVTSFKLTIPGSADPSGGAVKFFGLAKAFDLTGIGSMIVMAIDSSDTIDTNASIDATTRIWSLPTDGSAPISQSIPLARATLFSAHAHAAAAGLRHDSQFRTNSGIVNLSGQSHQFTIQIDGERANGQLTIEVPAFSLAQVPLPEGDYGALTLDVLADRPDARWLLYGSSVDRTTGEAQTSLGTPSQ